MSILHFHQALTRGGLSIHRKLWQSHMAVPSTCDLSRQLTMALIMCYCALKTRFETFEELASD
jgi:hypothetical protein